MVKYVKIFLFEVISLMILTFLFVFSFLNIFHEFGLVTEKALLLVSIIVAAVVTIVGCIATIRLIITEQKTRLEHWFINNISKIVLIYFLSIWFFFSLRSEVFLTMEDMKNLISLEWSILGLSITIFLIWHVVTIEYLQKKIPIKPQSDLPTKIWIYIQEKEDFYYDASTLLSKVYLLIINLAIVCLTTGYIYISSSSSLFTPIAAQCIVIFALYLCTNTIIALLLDIFKPFNEKKKALLEESKTTIADIELQNRIDKDTHEILTIIHAIKNLEIINQEEKEKLVCEIMQKYIDKYDDASCVQTLKEGGNNDQL